MSRNWDLLDTSDVFYECTLQVLPYLNLKRALLGRVIYPILRGKKIRPKPRVTQVVKGKAGV